jgi:hypothetical protein
MIFVSVASYRDPELPATVRDCLDKARHPERLRFGICWQHGDDERLPEWLDGDQFTVLDIDWRASRGACWARAAIMDLWEGEDWYLQLDSHHRFVHDWDVRLLEQASATGVARPVLSTYAAAFPDEGGPHLPSEVTRMHFDRFTDEGDFLAGATVIAEPPAQRPFRARFVSAHFLFAPGRFVEDVPYDPDLYFIGEETTLAVRAFTHGYDLFHPGVPIVSHKYSRDHRQKHWDDHRRDEVTLAWDERNAASRAKVRRLLAEPYVGHYGLGSERTLADYEAYAGISFARHEIADEARRQLEPPAPPARRAPSAGTATPTR